MEGLILIGIAASALVAGGAALKGKRVGNPHMVLAGAMATAFGALLVGGILSLLSSPAAATEAATAAATASGSMTAGLAFLGAGLSTGLACIGAGIAVGIVGAAALGVVGEKPEMLGMTLIYLGLAEGIAIYGVIISLLVMGKV